MPSVRTCSDCELTKPLTEFSQNRDQSHDRPERVDYRVAARPLMADYIPVEPARCPMCGEQLGIPVRAIQRPT